MIVVSDDGPVRRITLDRPERRNAVTGKLAIELRRALEAAAADDGVRVIVLAGAGPVFSAGIDLDELRGFADAEYFRGVRTDILAAWNLLEQTPKPTIARIQGAAVGVSCELTLACDFRIIAENAIIGLPETKYGAVPDVGAPSRLPSLVGLGKAKELIMTSALIDGGEAERIGLVTAAVPADDLDAAVADLCERLLACSSAAVGRSKLILDAAAKPALAETLRQEIEYQVEVIQSVGLRPEELAERLNQNSS